MGVHKLVPSLGVSSISRSVAFYQEYFGFAIIDRFEPDGELQWCHLRAGSAELMLQQLAEDHQTRLEQEQSWVLLLCPDDLQDVWQRLQDGGHGATVIERTPDGTEEFLVDDPDGYELWISSPRPD